MQTVVFKVFVERFGFDCRYGNRCPYDLYAFQGKRHFILCLDDDWIEKCKAGDSDAVGMENMEPFFWRGFCLFPIPSFRQYVPGGRETGVRAYIPVGDGAAPSECAAYFLFAFPLIYGIPVGGKMEWENRSGYVCVKLLYISIFCQLYGFLHCHGLPGGELALEMQGEIW